MNSDDTSVNNGTGVRTIARGSNQIRGDFISANICMYWYGLVSSFIKTGINTSCIPGSPIQNNREDFKVVIIVHKQKFLLNEKF